MEAMATALRARGFEVVVSPDPPGATNETIDIVLMFAGASASSVIVAINKNRILYPSSTIILVGANYTDDEMLLFIEAGMQAYTSSSASLEQLIDTITAAQRGESQCSPTLGALVAARITALAKSPTASSQPRLTAREQEIFRLLAAGLSNKEISTQLSISLNTVKIHVHRILEKLQMRRRREAVRWISARASGA